MNIIIVGIHHKEGKPALCSTTKSGKMIDEAIRMVNSRHPDIFNIQKTNLFPREYLPKGQERTDLLAKFKANIQPNTLYIGLGNLVGNWLSNNLPPLHWQKINHPAYYMRRYPKKDWYIYHWTIIEHIELFPILVKPIFLSN